MENIGNGFVEYVLLFPDQEKQTANNFDAHSHHFHLPAAQFCDRQTKNYFSYKI